jgi:hypothetical protein
LAIDTTIDAAAAPRHLGLRKCIFNETEDDHDPGDPGDQENHETAISPQSRQEQADSHIEKEDDNGNDRANDVEDTALVKKMPCLPFAGRLDPDHSKRTTDVNEQQPHTCAERTVVALSLPGSVGRLDQFGRYEKGDQALGFIGPVQGLIASAELVEKGRLCLEQTAALIRIRNLIEKLGDRRESPAAVLLRANPIAAFRI